MEEESTKNDATGSGQKHGSGTTPSTLFKPVPEARERPRHGYALLLASVLTFLISQSMRGQNAIPAGSNETVRSVSFHGGSRALASAHFFGHAASEPRWNLAPSFAVLVLVTLMIRCTWTDIEFGRIRNADTYPAAVAIVTAQILAPLLYWGIGASLPGNFEPVVKGAGFAPVSELVGARDLSECLKGGVLCFSIMLFSFLTAGGGGGDVKLGTVIGLALGPRVGAFSLIYSYLAAGAYLCGLFMYWQVRDRARRFCLANSFEIPSNGAPAVVRQAGSNRLFGRRGMWLRMSPFFLIGTFVAMIEAMAGGVR